MSNTPLLFALCLVSLAGSCWTVDFTLITETGLLRLYSDNSAATPSSHYDEEYFDVSQALCNLGVERCYRTISKIIHVPTDDSYVVLHGGMLYRYDIVRRSASCLRCTRLPLILDVAYNTKRDLLFWLQSTRRPGYIHMHAFPYNNGTTLKEKERLSLLNIPSKTIDRPKLMYHTKTDSALILTVEQNEMYAFGTYSFARLRQSINLNAPTTTTTTTTTLTDLEEEDASLFSDLPTPRAPLTLFRNHRISRRSLRGIDMSHYFNISTLSMRRSCNDSETGMAVSCMNFDSCVVSSLDEWMGKVVVNFMCELLPGFSVLYDPYTFITPNAFLLTWGAEMEARVLRFDDNTMLLLPRYNTSHMDIWRMQRRSSNFMQAATTTSISLPTNSDLMDVVFHKKRNVPIASYLHQTSVLRRYGSKKLIDLIRSSTRYVLNFHRPVDSDTANMMQILTEEELEHLLELEQTSSSSSSSSTPMSASAAHLDVFYINSMRYGLPLLLVAFSLAFLSLTIYYICKIIKLYRFVHRPREYHDEEMQHLSLPRVKSPAATTTPCASSSITNTFPFSHPEYKK